MDTPTIFVNCGRCFLHYDGERPFIVDYTNYVKIVIYLKSTCLRYNIDYYDADRLSMWLYSQRIIWDIGGCSFFTYPIAPLSMPCYIALNIHQMVKIVAEQTRQEITGNKYTTMPARFMRIMSCTL